MPDERDQELKASQSPIQIREGAGLEEARYNLEFIEWLRKWSGPILVVVAVVAGGYALRNHLQTRDKANTNAAFSEFEAARSGSNPNPDTLVAIADQYAGVGAVPIMARLEAGDAYMDSVRRGVKPGSVVNPDGTLASIEDELKVPDRDALLAKASEQYQWVVDNASKTKGMEVHVLGGLYGLASISESKGDDATTKATYERIVTLAESAGFARHAALAKNRLATLAQLASLDPLPSRASVPTPLDTTPTPPEPVPAAEPALAPAPVPAPASDPAPANPAPPN